MVIKKCLGTVGLEHFMTAATMELKLLEHARRQCTAIFDIILFIFLYIARDQAKQRLEQDAWVERIEQNMVTVTEASIRDAFQKCFPDLAEQNISTSDMRRMSKCLSLAGWLRSGKFNSGSRRNQVRFINPSPVLEQSETNYEF